MFSAYQALDVFRKQLAAYPGGFSEQASRVDGGGRVLLPASCLAELSTMNVVYPLQFCIRSRQATCYAGVLEFNADDGIVIMPLWMFSTLLLQPGDTVTLETCVLPPGKLIKLRPQQMSFVQLSDPKHVLEMHLSHYPVLTKGTSIVLQYLDREFVIDVIDITDENDCSVQAISTVRADAQATELKVEFERPLDMPPSPTEEESAVPQGVNVIGSADGLDFTPFAFKPPMITTNKDTTESEGSKEQRDDKSNPGFLPFAGGGRRLNERPVAASSTVPVVEEKAKGTEKTADEKVREAREKRFQAFSGTGRSLR